METNRLSKNKYISKGGLWLCGLSFCLSLHLFVFSLPHIGIGIWPQSELAVTMLHVTAALCTLGMLAIAFLHPKLVSRVAIHPFVIFPAALGLLSLAVMPFEKLPMRHFLGAPQTGEGVAWWFDWAALAASGLLLLRFSFWKKALTAAAISGSGIAFLLCMNYKYNGVLYAPYYFADFLAVSFFCLIPLVVLFRFPAKKYVWGVLYILLIILLDQIDNKAAFAYSLIGIPFFIALKFTPFLSRKLKTIGGITVLAALPVIALIFMLSLPLVMGDGGYYDFSKIKPLRTVLSRSYLIETGLAPLQDNPALLLTGTGWGTFTEHVVGFIPNNWYDFTREGTQQWEGVAWDQFHSHNIYVDTLFSVGLIGTLLIFLYITTIPAFAKRRTQWPVFIFTGGLVSAVSFWFLLPSNIPFIALALGATGKSHTVKPFYKPVLRLIVPLLFTVFTLQASGGALAGLTMKKSHRYMPQALSTEQALSDCPLEYNDFGAGGLHLARMLLGRERVLVKQTEEPEKINKEKFDKEKNRINHLFCQSLLYTKQNEHVSNRLIVAQLLVQSEISLGLQEYLTPEEEAFYRLHWKDTVLSWLTRFPSRTDQAVPFLLDGLIHNDEAGTKEIASIVYAANPDDPVGLWFTGLTMIADPRQTKEGLRRMRAGLANGIERYMPIEEEIKQQLAPR